MNWRKGTLQKVADPGTEFTWATHSFAGNDPLEEALGSGYFDQWAAAVRPGDLILWGCNPDRTGRTRAGNPVALRRALLMVTHVVGIAVTVRLLQDWGGVGFGCRRSRVSEGVFWRGPKLPFPVKCGPRSHRSARDAYRR